MMVVVMTKQAHETVAPVTPQQLGIPPAAGEAVRFAYGHAWTWMNVGAPDNA